MPRKPMPVEQIRSIIAATPAGLAELTAGPGPSALRQRPAADAWSANEVLAHLRACADMWGGAMMRIATEERPAIRAINPLAWIERTDYLELDFRPSLQAFATQRAELLDVLRALPPDGWARSTTVTGAGAPLERSVRDYGERMAAHERPHVKQIAAIVETLSA